jgi:hypothetical protein
LSEGNLKQIAGTRLLDLDQKLKLRLGDRPDAADLTVRHLVRMETGEQADGFLYRIVGEDHLSSLRYHPLSLINRPSPMRFISAPRNLRASQSLFVAAPQRYDSETYSAKAPIPTGFPHVPQIRMWGLPDRLVTS